MSDQNNEQQIENISEKLNLFERMLLVFKNAWKNMRNKNVPGRLKLVYIFYLAMELVYIISPIDILPEWLLPVLGFADDLAMLPLMLHTLSRFNKRSEKHLHQLPPPDNVEKLPPHDPPKKEASDE